MDRLGGQGDLAAKTAEGAGVSDPATERSPPHLLSIPKETKPASTEPREPQTTLAEECCRVGTSPAEFRGESQTGETVRSAGAPSDRQGLKTGRAIVRGVTGNQNVGRQSKAEDTGLVSSADGAAWSGRQDENACLSTRWVFRLEGDTGESPRVGCGMSQLTWKQIGQFIGCCSPRMGYGMSLKTTSGSALSEMSCSPRVGGGGSPD